jgi:hypothetical protein
MKYIRKICPTCGNEFVVLENVEEKAVYCTLECLLDAQDHDHLKGDGVSSLMLHSPTHDLLH